MRLGIDFDGTVADITDAKIRFAREHFNEDITPRETYREHGIGRLGEERFIRMVHEAHATAWTLSMQPMAGALESLHTLAADHDLFIVTARNDDEIDWARQWLERHDLPIQDVLHTSREPKTAACESLGVHLMLDDSPYVLRGLAGTDLHLALIDAEYNRDDELPARTHRVEGWTAFEELVARVAGTTAPAR
jgi:uncharacterized HAD superfamily protein